MSKISIHFLCYNICRGDYYGNITSRNRLSIKNRKALY